MSKAHTIIGETLRVSTFFAQFLRDRFEFAEVSDGVAEDSRVEWAADVLAEWNARPERRGRPPAAVTEARAILGVESKADLARKPNAIEHEHVEAAVAVEASLIALMVKASRIERIGEAATRQRDTTKAAQADAVLAAMAEDAERQLDALKDLVGSHNWQAWLKNDGKSHLDGLKAAKRANRGTHWTASRKGHATTIRYDDSADFQPTVKRHAANVSEHSLDEDAILAAIEAEALAVS
jgi:hypothetical protein